MKFIVDSEQLPMGWKIKKLADICDLQNGYAFQSKSYTDYSDTLNIRMSNIRPCGEFDPEHNIRFLPNSFAIEYSQFLLKEGDLIIAMTDMAGDPKILGLPTLVTQLNGRKFLLNQRVGKLHSFSKEVNISYLRFFLSSPKIKKYYKSRGAGGLQINISKKDILSVRIPFPPLPEQKQIVAILDEAFEGIDRAIANTEKNLANARELFESYLNKTFAQKGNGWEEKTLREVSSEFGRGKSKHRPRNDPKLYGGSYPFIQTGDVRNCNHFITQNSQFYSEIGLAQSKLWPKGTICITIAANIAETGILGFDACFPDSIIGIVVNDEITSNDFVEYLLQSVKARIKAKGQGSAQDNINLATFENERFPFPNLEQQKLLVSRLNKLSSETRHLEAIYRRKIAALNALKQSILQKAFTGELTADHHQTTEAAEEEIAA